MVKYYGDIEHPFAGGQRVAMRQGNGTGVSQLYWLLSDHLGGTAMQVDAVNANPLTDLRYKPWGEARAGDRQGDTPTDFQYTGQRIDSYINIYWYGSRWYDPALSRWIQPDSIVPDPGNPASWDRYSYTFNRPTVLIDPTGHKACDAEFGCSEVAPPKTSHSSQGQSLTKEEKKCGGGGCGLEKINKNKSGNQRLTLTDKIKLGDTQALAQLLIPSHIGGRLQLEVSFTLIIGVSVSGGVNLVYNRNSDELAANVDWTIEGGAGLGAGASGTGGLLIGWGSSSVGDITKGFSGIVSGTAAAEVAVSAAVTAPLDEKGLHVDPYSGQVPPTGYVGVGAGGGYAGVGGGINGPTGIHVNLTSLLPWHWFK